MWAARDVAAVARTSAPPLTQVELIWIQGRIEHWIRFGAVSAEMILDRRRRRVAFAPGAVFALVRWQANSVGTVSARLDILRAPGPGEAAIAFAGVTPGAVSLLRVAGWPRVRAALAAIDAIEALGVDPAQAAPDYWRHVHNCLTSRTTPVTYDLRRHRAWSLRRALQP